MSLGRFGLPQESFVGVPVKRVANPVAIWAARTPRWRNTCFETYALTTADDDRGTSGPEDVLLAIADRYGGPGLGVYGGSARCAAFDGVQIKGVGLTPLHAKPTGRPHDPWHSSGTTNIHEAIREAVFSGVCEAVLPYGAVSCGAILSTGTLTLPSYVELNSRPSVARVLILREFAVRPAHFMRNIRFRPEPRLSMAGDTSRVRHAIRALPLVFERELGVSGANSVSDGMVLLAGRYASQLAAAHAKRLFHAGISPSNIALDGRFMDFGTMTAVPGYVRRSGAPDPAGPDIWNQDHQLEQVLLALLQHVHCYLELPPGTALLSSPELLVEFRRQHGWRLALEFTKLCGLPEGDLMRVPAALVTRTFRCLSSIALRGNRRKVWRGDDDIRYSRLEPVPASGRHDLNVVLRAFANNANNGSTSALEAVLGDSATALELNDCLEALFDACLAQFPHPKRDAVRSHYLDQCFRLNGDLEFITREAIDEASAAFETDLSGLGMLVDATVAKAVHVLRDSLSFDAVR